MLGQVLDYSIQENKGIINGEDGNRYTFLGSEWKDVSVIPKRGLKVDFRATEDGVAVEVYRSLSAGGINTEALSSGLQSGFEGLKSGFGNISLGQKNKIVASILAFFFGSVGVHRFYLGNITQGFTYIGTLILAIIFQIWSVSLMEDNPFDPPIFAYIFMILGLILLAIVVIRPIVDIILFMTKSDEKFQEIYVKHK